MNHEELLLTYLRIFRSEPNNEQIRPVYGVVPTDPVQKIS